jgi:putative N6-adenine-specific DNA methylase/tRNA (guanine6-N2)-methyltransferase
MTSLLLTTNGGLEDVVEAEFRELADEANLEYGRIDTEPFGLDGRVRVETEAPVDQLVPMAREMRSIHHVLRYVHNFEFDRNAPESSVYEEVRGQSLDELDGARTFRVTSNRYGDHDFTSMDVQAWAGQAVVDRYGTEVDLEDYDVDVRVDVVEDRCLIGIQYTREALSKRHPRVFSPKVSLKTNVAFAMLHLAHIDEHEPDVLLDPFCGAGTIPIEAALVHPELEVHGSDWWGVGIEGSRENAEAAGVADRTTFAEVDARDLVSHYGRDVADVIVTNPPYGAELGESINFHSFYRNVLDQMSEVLRPEGRVAMLVDKRGIFNGAVGDLPAFEIRHVRIVTVGGLYPGLFVLQKREGFE